MINKAINQFLEVANMFKPIKCVICDGFILGHYKHDMWGQAAHEHHCISYCFPCGRIIAKNGIVLADGRHLCEHCKTSIVQTQQQIDWINKKVREVFAKIGFNDIPQNVPIEICNANKILNLQGGNIIDPNQRGLAHLTKTIINGITKLEHKIFIIDNLTKTAFAGVLAHELLHVWQNDKGICPPKNICEGFCNLGSCAVYCNINNITAQNLLKQIEECPDPIYGEGYRKVKRYLDKNGWAATIAKIKKYKA